MEHRWGERSTLEMPVRIDCGSQAMAIAVLRDASVSGAFLCTSARLGLLTTVEVTLLAPECDAQAVDALVVRSTAEGYGIEWIDVAPRAIVEILAALRAAHAPAPTQVAQLPQSSGSHGREPRRATRLKRPNVVRPADAEGQPLPSH